MWIYIVTGIVVLLVIWSIYDGFRKEKQLLERAKRTFGLAPEEEMTPERYRSLAAFLESLPKQDTDIDEITWNDLDMDRIFAELNHTCSAVGEEVLFSILHRPQMTGDELVTREKLIDLFLNEENARNKAGRALLRMGKMRRISVYDYMMRLHNVRKESNLRHYLMLLPYIAAVVLMIVGETSVGVGLFLGCALLNIATYMKRKGEIEPYLDVVSYIVRWLNSVEHLSDELSEVKNETLSGMLAEMKKDASGFHSFVRLSGVLAQSTPTESITELVMAYMRMLFHIDLIKFNRIFRTFEEHQDELNRLFLSTGMLDAMRAVASYRVSRNAYCVPILRNDRGAILKAEGICHPLVSEPVANSITADRPVLLTGSNASGKSTFLKTLAVNAILAQTVHTVLADAYEASYFRILSSMALRDDLAKKESYYIVEIRSLKRIMDASEGEYPLLCFVDEVLRGTNTAERIAASSRILRYLAEKHALVFAATHDLELTSLLSDVYENYHFSEQVRDDIVVFDYRLKPGKANSRNALKLLKMMDYPKEITDSANTAVEQFLTTGEWQ